MAFSTFTSEIQVRPDDIDVNNHVHFSKYLDFVLAARYEQMARDYKVSMEEFVKRGLAWVVSGLSVQYKRSLVLGDTAVIKTHINSVSNTAAVVGFEIYRKSTNKLSAEGQFEYTLVNTATGRAEQIPDDIVQQYSI